MTEPVPEFYSVPGTEAIHKAPARQGGEFTFPFTPQQLLQIGAELIEQFLRRVVNALAGVFIPGLDAFTQLQNWGNDVGEFIGNIFDTIADALNDLLGAIFGGVNFLDLPTPGEFWSSAVSMFNPGTIGQNLVSGLQGALAALDDWITDIIIGIGNALDDIPIVGRDLEAAMLRLFNIKQKAVTADARSTQIVEDVQAAWAGDTPTGTPTAVYGTVEAIRTAIGGGFTLWTFSVSDPTWPVPPELATATEAFAGVFGGGGRGQNGQKITTGASTAASATGGAGGSSGGYIGKPFNPSALGSTLNITIGAPAATAGTDGGATSIVNGATTIVQSIVNISGIGTTEGYVTSTSIPGRGGDGGGASYPGSGTGPGGSAGAVGEPSATAAGGAAGSGSGGAGGDGAAGITAELPMSGGSGGGGGGGKWHMAFGATVNGGDGGDGGFPGAGSGGGGGAVGLTVGNTTNRGVAGIPGSGLAFIIAKGGTP